MENEVKNSFRSGYSKGLGFGLFLLLLGVVFLGLNFGFIPHELRHVLISWPMLLIVMGIGNFFKNRHPFSGVILIMIGSFFIMPRVIEAYPAIFPGFNGDFTHIYWPLLLIAAGILIILGKIFGPKWGWHDWNAEWQNRNHRHHRHYRHSSRDYSNWTNPEGFSKNSVFVSLCTFY